MNLPLDEQILFDVKVLHPLQKNMSKATNVIKRLAAVVIHALGKKAKEVFKFDGEDYQLSDLILKEFAEYQIEVIPDTYYLKKKEKKRGRPQQSYWSYAFKEAGVENYDREEESYCRVDDYWGKVEGMLDECVEKRYFHLCSLAKCLLTLSHGNADPERGLSLTKKVLDIHGTSLSEETIVTIRMVKDFI